MNMPHNVPVLHAGRRLAKLIAPAAVLLAAGLLVTAATGASAKVYNDGDSNMSAFSTDPAGSFQELTIGSGSAEEVGAISGAGGIQKTGAGELMLGGNNTFTGGLIINEGIISFYTGGSRPDEALGAAGGALTLDGGQLHAYHSIMLDATRLVTLGAAGGTLSGNLTINQTIAGPGAFAIRNHGGGMSVITLGGLQNYTGATTVDGAGATLTISGTLLNHGGLTIANDGYVIVGSSNPQSRVEGRIDIDNGGIRYQGQSAATGTITVGAGNPLVSSDRPNARAEFRDAASAGNAVINIAADGELYFLDDAISGSATIANNGGVIRFYNDFGSASPTSSLTTIINNAPAVASDRAGGFIVINATTDDGTFAIGHLAGSGNVYIGDTTLVIGGLDDRAMTISGGIFYGDASGIGGLLGGITKTGDSALTLSGPNYYYGATTVSGGRLVLAAADTITYSGLVRIENSATLTLSADNILRNLGGDSPAAVLELTGDATATLHNALAQITSGGAHITISDGTTAFAGRITGQGSIRKTGDGSLALTGSNSHTGGTRLEAGTLVINSDNNLGAANATLSIAGVLMTPTLALDGDVNAAGRALGVSRLSDPAAPASHVDALIDTNGHLLSIGQGYSGDGRLHLIGGGTVAFHGAISNTNAIVNTAATLALAGPATADNATIIIQNSGAGIPVLDISGLSTPGITIGDLQSDGHINLGSKTLSIGALGGNMGIAGTITGIGGILEKTGSGNLTLGDCIGGHTGGTRIVQGAINYTPQTTDAAFGAPGAPLAIDGGTLAFWTSANFPAARPFVMGAAGGTLDTSIHDIIIDGPVTGAGSLLKNGGGILTLNGASAHSGPTTIAAGTLQIGDASHPEASITGNITIASDATLAGYGHINGNITNNGTISLGAAFEPAAFPMPAPIRAFAAAAIPSAAAAAAAGNHTIQGSLINNNLLRIGRAGGVPGNTLTITGSYSGNGVIRLNTDLSTGRGDSLVILGSAAGGMKLMLGNATAPNAPIPDDATLNLVTLPAASTASITLVDGAGRPIDYIEAGLLTFQIAPVGGTLQLLSYNRQSHAADAILATASIAGAEWHYTLDNLSKRLGDLRAENLNRDTGAAPGSVWMRLNTHRINAAPGLSGAGFHEYASAIDGGLDVLRLTPHGALYLGGHLSIGRVDRAFDNHGDGSTGSLGLGLYATFINPGGWYLDMTARFERNKNDFNARALDGHVTGGRYTARNEILSIEAGRRLEASSGWWLEPGVQIAAAWLGGGRYTTTGATEIGVSIDDSMAMQYRMQLRTGRRIGAGRWNPYIKFAAAKNDSDSATITAWDKAYARDCDGWRAETGAGVSCRIDARSQVYLDYEYAKASLYERPWSLTLGYRRSW